MIEICVEHQQAKAVETAGVEAGALGDVLDGCSTSVDQVVVAQAPVGVGAADVKNAVEVVQSADLLAASGTEVAAEPDLVVVTEVHAFQAVIDLIIVFGPPMVGMADEAVAFGRRGGLATGNEHQESPK